MHLLFGNSSTHPWRQKISGHTPLHINDCDRRKRTEIDGRKVGSTNEQFHVPSTSMGVMHTYWLRPSNA